MHNFLLTLMFSISFTTQSLQAREAIETAGDIVVIALPATTYGLSYYIEDDIGRQQFHYSFATMLLTTAVLKLSINKSRPDDSNNRSFPSGHSAIAFHSAGYLRKRYGWKPALPAFAAASFVGYSRIEAYKHFVEDVIAGALLGFASAEWFTSPCSNCQLFAFKKAEFSGLSFKVIY